ncbi:hypothetical protein SISNIDRAFT_134090 [Sistotremastrum niveocremeum HHB9708]|uniref:SET domain-containing protein n=1 Tax=Sistotremastrum niveocremeum HHB9708 TaxID=1314777 RepID=A0A164ZWJ1_9AGAM|nr:hypothetical protein SISNIDRAFT_134090 [Sistotremastrum niveocremeum HHB9708]
MRGAVVAHGGHSRVGEVAWSSTSNMNMRDLSRDDDFLSFMLVEQLGTDSFPLVVHKMDPSRRLPRHDPKEILNIVQRWIVTIKSASSAAKRVRGAVDALLRLEAVAHYLRGKTQMQINAFATHASRYFELYVPTGTIEIAHTSRYSKWTGKAELCILATTTLKIGTVITELKGSMAVLTEDENEELKRTDRRNTDGGIRRDFSVIHSGHRKKNHLFLGPARFVNHDCDNNCELFREGKYITFRVIKPIERGQEITAHYGDAYFGKDNRHCLCETCEKRGKGGYRQSDYTDSDASSDSASTIPPRETLGQVQKVEMLGEVNERRTRRGVYLKLPDSESDSEEEVQTEVTEAVIQIDDPEDANTASRSSSLSKLSTPPLSSIPTSPGALINPLPTPDSLSSRSQSESAQGDRPSDQAPSSTAATSTTFTPVKAQAVKSLSLSEHNLIAKQSSTLSSSPRANIQLKSPPLSEDAHSIPDEAQSSQAATTLPAAPAQRRFSARLNTRTPERNKELTPRAKSRHRTAESTDDKKIATPQTRASTVQSQDRKASTPVADEPRSLRSKSKPALPPKAKPRVSGTPADKGKAADEKAKTALASPKRRGKKKAPPPRLCKVCSRELPPLNPDSADEDSEEDKGECSR